MVAKKPGELQVLNTIFDHCFDTHNWSLYYSSWFSCMASDVDAKLFVLVPFLVCKVRGMKFT